MQPEISTLHRTSGILLHPTALTGPGGIGSFSREALQFIDFLAAAGQSVWQMLPLGPTGYGDSPYNALSAFAGNPLLIDFEQLVAAGDLPPQQNETARADDSLVDFEQVSARKSAQLLEAANRFLARQPDDSRAIAFHVFCREQADWLDDFSLYMAIRADQQLKPWWQWPKALRNREQSELDSFSRQKTDRILTCKFQQFVFFEQWAGLRSYAKHKGVQLFGDMPIFVARDSADVWAHQQLFELDNNGQPTVVAGVPPDYFSATGQLWGNPLYRWQKHVDQDFNWWLRRFRHQLQLFDLLRIDHFRGFAACWAIPADHKTAEKGAWQQVPGKELFTVLNKAIPDAAIVAEDLGIITPDVEALRDSFGFPGMKILQFAFDSDALNPYLPHNYRRRAVVYTGTHDNDTTFGWWQELSREQRKRVSCYLGKESAQMPWDLIQLAMSSVAQLCIIPCQDLLALGSEARFNRPGQAERNWTWRLTPHQLDDLLAQRLLDLTRRYNRLPNNR